MTVIIRKASVLNKEGLLERKHIVLQEGVISDVIDANESVTEAAVQSVVQPMGHGTGDG